MISRSLLSLACFVVGFAQWTQNLTRPKPSPPTEPTQVYVTAFTLSVRKLNAPDSSFVVDSYIYFAWRDDRSLTSAFWVACHMQTRLLCRWLNAADGALYTASQAVGWRYAIFL